MYYMIIVICWLQFSIFSHCKKMSEKHYHDFNMTVMDEQPFAQIPENVEIKKISTGGGGNSLTAKNANGKIWNWQV